MDWADLRRRRLARSHLAERAHADELVAVAYDVCGIHAQVQSSAELQLAARVDGLTQSDVREALWERRMLVKAWTVRGTLHLHPAEDLPGWLAARRAVTRGADGGLAAWRDTHGVLHPALSESDVATARAAVWEALDGRCLTREEVVAEVAGRVPATVGARLRSGFAFFLDEVCQGRPRGSRVTFVRPDQWIEGWAAVGEGEALREVHARFVRAYSPTRAASFREWFGGDGPDDVAVAGSAGSAGGPVGARLVAEYDPYVMGFREREQLVPEYVRELIASHGRGRFEGAAAVPLVLVDGVAQGIWRRSRRGKRIELEVVLVGAPSRALHAELEDEAERIGRFLALGPLLSVETVARQAARSGTLTRGAGCVEGSADP